MTDAELENMGFLREITLPNGIPIRLHSENFIKTKRLKAGVEGSIEAFEVYRKNQSLLCDTLSSEDWCKLQNAMFGIKIFTGVK